MGQFDSRFLLAIASIALALAAVAFLANRHPPPARSADPTATQAVAPPSLGKLPSSVEPTASTTVDEVDVCGYGRVERGASEQIETTAQTAADRFLGRFAAKLTSSSNEHEAALGLFLDPWMLEGIRDEYLHDHPDCNDNQTCQQYASDLANTKTVEIEEAVVKGASGTRDPRAYALALQACGTDFGSAFDRRAGAACSLLSAERWAELEPDNGVPWVLVALKANDAAARDQAVYHASTAKRFDAYSPNFAAMLQRPEIRSEAPQTRWAIGDELFAMELRRPLLSYRPLLQFCNYPSIADATRISACSDLANLLLTQDRTLMGLGTAVRLAQSADWPRDKLDALRDEKEAVYKAAQGGVAAQEPGKAVGDCEDLARFERWSADYAELGQLGVARRLVESTSKLPAQRAPTLAKQVFERK
jgi:hypothetical protein